LIEFPAVAFAGRERPQLLLTKEGVPEALFSGAGPPKGTAAGTFTMVQPVVQPVAFDTKSSR
jgi:hypothetical protein